MQAKSVSYSPLLNEMRNRWKTFFLALPALIFDRRVVATMKLEKWNVVSARVTRDGHIVGCTRQRIDVESARNWGKRSYAVRHYWVAGQDIAKPGAVRLSSCKDTGRVNTILALDMVEDICGELNIVYGDVWNALPCVLGLLVGIASSNCNFAYSRYIH